MTSDDPSPGPAPITARTGKIRLHDKDDEVREVPLPAVARERVGCQLAVSRFLGVE
jgi:hypothetical protein